VKGGLRRFVGGAAPPPPPAEKTVERCEMCAEPIADWPGHVVDVEGRGLMCTCRPVALLFTKEGAGGGRYRYASASASSLSSSRRSATNALPLSRRRK